MARQAETSARRLRRLARMLVDDAETADALVLETLTAAEDQRLDLTGLFALLISRRRSMPVELGRRGRRAGQPQPDIMRALEALPLQDREVLALTLVEQFAYEDAARVLKLTTEIFMARLSQARTAFARAAEGERHVILRLVK
jgi:DNA-directed RNA polymerase specialized sigma24 family protein